MKNLQGQRFGRLIAIERKGSSKHARALWLCTCDCGNQKIVQSDSLIQGRTRSCGCLDKEKHISDPNRTVHGFSGKRIYRIWKKMKSRCHNPNDPDYQKWYGSQGIKVCDNWRYCFQAFYRWSICHGYKNTLSIDRIDPTGNYEPSNCRWATAKQQANNKRNTPVKGGDSN